MTRFATSSYATAATAAAIAERFRRPEPVAPCRHCRATEACSCGQKEREEAVQAALAMLPQLRTEGLKIHIGDFGEAVRKAGWANATPLFLLDLHRAASSCARSARAVQDDVLAMGFDEVARLAKVAADALPR